MAEPEPDPSDTPSTASCAAPSAIAGTTPDPTAAYRPEPLDALGAAGRATETGVPAGDETDVEPSAHLPQIPGYNVLRTIGGGGMGTAFKAVHLGLNRVVALKLINAGWVADDEFRARFDREAKTLAALEHANVVPVFDAGTWQGLPFLTMKFVAGKTLYHRLEVVRRDMRKAARLMVQVARAVEYLHSRGIIHRDLKPLNILLTADGTPLVADFGRGGPLADDSEMSVTVVPLGTRQYMSPEQSRGGRQNYTPACDIWALGIILYELLAGYRPFGHDDPLELFRRIRFEPMPPVPADRRAPPEFEAIARKCLEKSPTDRYPTAEAVAADLERWLKGEPISVALPALAPVEAPAELPPANSVKKSQRSRVVKWVLAAIVFGAVALGAAAAAGAFKASPEPQGAGGDPNPALPKQPAERTALERFNAGDPVVFTDATGKPIGATTAFAGHEVAERTEDGFHEFTSTKTGLAELSAETFPLPLRVTAEVALTHGTAADSFIGVYVGRRDWAGTPVLHRSLLWFGFRDEFPNTGEQRLCQGALYWWEKNAEKGLIEWQTKPTPRKCAGGKDSGPLFWRVEIVVRKDTINAKINGVDLKPITTAWVAGELGFKVREHPQLGQYAFNPPFFGSGIGICVCNANGIVADLTVSKLTP